jgi:ABC-2 type transport system permease protein
VSAVHGYLAMTRTEFRLFRREPFSVVFVLAFPLMMMVLLAAVFGNKQADAGKFQNGMLVWRGVTPANYYTAASVAVIVAALGLLTLPITLAGYRERGILRRFRASSVPASTQLGAQLTLAFATFVAGALVMVVIARLTYHARIPRDVPGVVVALGLGTAAFGAIGLLLATVLRTSRSAQGIGLLLFFALWLISGTAPPRAVLPSGLRTVGGVLPLTHLVTAVQNPWFGFGWSAGDLAALAAYAVAIGLPALWLFSRQ